LRLCIGNPDATLVFTCVEAVHRNPQGDIWTEDANTGVPVLGIKSATSGTPDVDAKRSLEGQMACTGSSFEAR